MRTGRRRFQGMIMSAWLGFTATAYAEGNDLGAAKSMTLDDYVQRAIDIGITGVKNSLSLKTAGYAREIVFRQNEAPTASVGYTQNRQGSETNGVLTDLSRSNSTDLKVTENTALGTALSATGSYGSQTDANLASTGGAPITSTTGKPALALSGSQPIYLFVKNPVARALRRADLAFADAEAGFLSTKLNIRTQARSNYYAVMQAEEAIQVAKRKADSSQKLLDVTQALVNAGKSAPVETMRAKITLQTDQRALNNAMVTHNQAILTAKNYIFMPLDQDIQFISKLTFKPFTVSLDKIISYAMLHQPNLQILRRAQETALLDYQAALEPTRPALSVNGTYNYARQPVDLFALTEYVRGWSWTLNANWLFFDSGVTRDQVREAQIERTVADLNLTDGERTTQLNIRNAYMDVIRTAGQIAEFQTSRDQAQRDVDVLRLRFQNGLATLLDVFDGENSVRDLDTEYLGLLVQFNQSKDNLSTQVGADVDTL